jgi:recombination protein RecR
MDSLARLTEIFTHFPGIGPRQAKRFTYYLLTRDSRTLSELARLIEKLKNLTHECLSCHRFFATEKGGKERCSICSDTARSEETLMVVEKDVDFENIERTKLYSGRYFILGGSIPVLDKEPEKRVRASALKKRVKDDIEKGALKEIILALAATAEGDHTERYLRELLNALIEPAQIKLSHLGRGLSTGTELEYSDAETIRNALKNRG